MGADHVRLPEKIGVPIPAAWNAKEDLLATARSYPNREDVADVLYGFHRRCAEPGRPGLERLSATVRPGGRGRRDPGKLR